MVVFILLIQILIEHFIRNHGDPDQRPRSVASDLGLQCFFFYVPQQEQVMHTIGSFLNRHLKQYFKIFSPFISEIPTQIQNFSLKQYESSSVRRFFGPDLDPNYLYQNHRH